ncbi:MAG TPA: sensor histidine kinase [Burkholderiaceae bacterium]|nr:sensor histidine kinase [Burkholderiaceae bacterium]
MKDSPLRVIVLDRSDEGVEPVRQALVRYGFTPMLELATSASTMDTALLHNPADLVVMAGIPPDLPAHLAVQKVTATEPTMPFVLVSDRVAQSSDFEQLRHAEPERVLACDLNWLGNNVELALEAADLNRVKQIISRARQKQPASQAEALTWHLQTTIDQERATIAREIHDDVGGALTALKFDLAWIERHADPTIAARARKAIHMLDHAMTASQRIMRNLRPAVLDDGVVAAIDWHVRQFMDRTGIDAIFTCNKEGVDLDEQLAMTVYRVCQEGLTNVAKHSQASQVKVDFVIAPKLLSLEISDNGRGFSDDDLSKPSSFGLRGLRERARKVGGWIDVSSSNDGRTTLILNIPVGGSDA